MAGSVRRTSSKSCNCRTKPVRVSRPRQATPNCETVGHHMSSYCCSIHYCKICKILVRYDVFEISRCPGVLKTTCWHASTSISRKLENTSRSKKRGINCNFVFVCDHAFAASQQNGGALHILSSIQVTCSICCSAGKYHLSNTNCNFLKLL